MADIAQEPKIEIPDGMRRGIFAVLVVTVILSIAATYFGAQRLLVAQTQSVAQGQHALYARSLTEAIRQHQHLPFILAQNPALATAVTQGDGDGLNPMLQDFSDAAGLEAIYVMGLDGTVLASSNFDTPGSFIGQNYGFRPYFQDALAGRLSDYFAIGATTGRPGYFVAEPLLEADGTPIGVIAIKLDISELQAAWEERGENVLATNADGIVLVSSNPDWLYGTIGPLEVTRRDEILRSRQFADEPLSPLPWTLDETGRLNLGEFAYFHTSGGIELVQWTVHYLTPISTVRRQIILATGVLGSILAGLIGFAVFLRSRRISAALAVSQHRRRELVDANAQLMKAQDDLARASKLAALGQLAASVTHELGQPISALKNHLLAAEIGNEITSPKTAQDLKRLTERMEGITKQLRFFARRNHQAMRPVDLKEAVGEAIALLRHDVEASDVALTWQPPAQSIVVNGEQLHLEQALVNLIRNAVQAAEEGGGRSVSVDITVAGADVRIDVTDSGAGLGGLTLHELQEPFFSTKSSGVGMGLGLAITSEIVREHGGALSVAEAAQGGCIFSVTLPRVTEEAP